MLSNYARFIRTSLLIGDLLVINLAFALGYLIKFKSFSNLSSDKYLVLFMVFNTAWLIVAYLMRAYSETRIIDLDKYVYKVIRVILLHTLLITAFWVARKAFYYSREQFLWTYVLLYPLMLAWRGAFFFFIKRQRKLGQNLRQAVLVGSGEVTNQLRDIFQSNPDYGYEILGVYDDNPVAGSNAEGNFETLVSLMQETHIDEIFCSMAEMSPTQIRSLTQLADDNVTRLRFLPDVRGIGYKRLNMEFYEHLPVLSIRNLPLDDQFNRALKRSFDIVFSLIVVVFVLSWLYPLMALLIKGSSPGPVLFKQLRSGQDNIEFECLKFRSMRMSAEADSKQAERGDDRITPLGRFIRRTSIDELPQFFNVLKGQMSVVGPRPHMLKHTEQYASLVEKYMVRHFVKPGITGLAQVKGYRGETSDTRMMEARVRLDRVYVESWNFLLDLWIILRTTMQLFRRDEQAF